ncbi:MAG: CocE/NonD family hydrolase, partial [Acidobacteriota bacterium]
QVAERIGVVVEQGFGEAGPGAAGALLDNDPDALRHLPVVDLPSRLWAAPGGWRGAVLAAEESAAGPLRDAELASLDVAALHVGGWHDPFCAETLRHFDSVGEGLDPRPPRALVMGPWWHRIDASRPARYGERRYGEASRFALGRFQAEWVRRALDGDAPADERRIFMAGDNRWLDGPDLAAPVGILPDGAAGDGTRFHLAGDRLSPELPASAGSVAFVHDAADPHPCRRTPLDESALPPRADVAVFEGAPLGAPLRVLGTPRLGLRGRTDAPQADWVARLLEVTAEGRRLYLAHGVVDAGRQLDGRGERLVAGEPHRVEIRLSPLGVTVPAGSRLRLEISGAGFPSYARNLASGEPRLTGTTAAAARQSVDWGPDAPSTLHLPASIDGAAGGEAALRLAAADRPTVGSAGAAR